MSRSSLAAVVGVLCIGAGFVAGGAIAIARGWGDPSVVVEVANQSGQSVESLSLRYESCGLKGTLVSGALAQASKTVFRFSVCGEASYQLSARLGNGEPLEGREAYVERGYRATEVVGKTAMVSTVSPTPY